MTPTPAPNSSASEAAIPVPDTIRVWDPLVRVLHWTLAGSFLAAYLFESPRSLHETLGYVVLGTVVLRIAWGFAGSAHARFASFVPGPSTFLGYLRDTLAGRERRYIGHNPAGGAMVIALLAAVLVVTGSGWMMTTDTWFGIEWVETLHETVANLAIGLVVFHLAGVVWESLRHRENLVAAMLTGRKRP
jgi:cytochrome b